MNTPIAPLRIACAMTALSTPWCQAQTSDPTPDSVQQAIVIQAQTNNNTIGNTDAASQGSVNAKVLQSRPTLRPAEVLESVPGVIVSQHSGDGKANQYYLRGFNLDHGTDFATFVDGMPVNMPTHAHGQGYTDLNWLIPELVDRISYAKGPYRAKDGDFASAGTASIKLVDTLPQGIGDLTLGEHGYRRALLAKSNPIGSGNLLYAIEAGHNDGPWDNPENFQRLNGLLRYSFKHGASDKSTLTAMGYTARWKATDQIPQQAVDQGLIDRFGAVDPSDHGNTQRWSLSYDWLHAMDKGSFKLNAYAIWSKLDLFSNFTYFLDDPVHGDQFEQAEKRQVLGLNASRTWDTTWRGHDTTTTVGLQVRQDRLSPVGLYTAEGGQRLCTTQESRVRETSVGLYAENSTQWRPWLRSVVGLRADHYNADVDSSIAANNGQRSAGLGSPKLSLIFGPWRKTEYFINYGQGFHSNDARGMTATVSPKEGTPTSPSTPLVRTQGQEIGLRTELIPGLQTSLALWQLKLDSELVFSGDAGDTEPSGASTRHGIELNNHYVAKPWLLFDLDIAASQARFNEPQGEPGHMGTYVPGAVETVASFGATVTQWGPWSGHFQLRYFGPRALIEDNSQRSHGTLLANARVGYQINKQLKLSLDVFNLFDRQASDIDYYYTSRISPSAAAASDIHFHPVEPRTFRLTLQASF